MKKFLFSALQIVSMFLFIVLLSGVYGILKDVINSKEGFAYNFGYCFGAVLILSLFFWLNFKLYQYATRRIKENS